MEIWPKISDKQSAMDAAHWSAGICYFVAVVTAIAAIIALISGHEVLGLDGWSLFDAVIFAFFGWRIWKLSRTVAVLALVLYCAEKTYQLSESKNPGNSIILILFILGLVQGIRGTFAYKKFSDSTDVPSEELEQTNVSTEKEVGGTIKRNWKRWSVIGLSIGAGLAATIALITWATIAYQNRESDVKVWPALPISGTAATVSLKTQWKDDLHYVLKAVPSTPDVAVPFHDATQDMSQVTFAFLLFDQSGFQLCEVDVDTPTVTIGSEGKRIALESNGETSLCSADKYRQASTWNINFKFPPLSTAPSSVPLVETPPQANPRSVGDNPRETSEGDDVVTGYDYPGHLDSKDGQFYIDRSGEQITAMSWDPGNKIHFKCGSNSYCVLENQTIGGTLHAKRIR